MFDHRLGSGSGSASRGSAAAPRWAGADEADGTAGAEWVDGERVYADDVVLPAPAVSPRIVPTGTAGAQLAALDPGADLAYLLEQAELEGTEDYDVVEVVAAWQRMASWVAAGTARAAAELADRPSMNPIWPATAGNVAEPNVAGDEFAMRLGCSRRQGRLLIRDGRAYSGALAWTGEALARGELDPTKARLLVNELADLPVPLALGVQEAVLEGASCRTPSQLSKDVARSMLVLDPAGCRAHRDIAVQGRRVDRPRVLPRGMAGLWAVLPAVGATRLDNALDALARRARFAGDPRTLDQLRADLLVDLTTGEVPGGLAELALAGSSAAATVPGAPGGLTAAAGEAMQPGGMPAHRRNRREHRPRRDLPAPPEATPVAAAARCSTERPAAPRSGSRCRCPRCWGPTTAPRSSPVTARLTPTPPAHSPAEVRGVAW